MRGWLIAGVVLGVLIVTATTTTVIWNIPPAYRIRAQTYVKAFESAERRYGLPPGLLARVAYQESRFDRDAVSPAGAIGLMQFMPATARDFKIDPRDPFQSIDAAARYLKALRNQFGSWTEALAAYNWGPGNVARKGLDQAPAETRNYYAAITRDLGIA